MVCARVVTVLPLIVLWLSSGTQCARVHPQDPPRSACLGTMAVVLLPQAPVFGCMSVPLVVTLIIGLRSAGIHPLTPGLRIPLSRVACPLLPRAQPHHLIKTVYGTPVILGVYLLIFILFISLLSLFFWSVV